MSENCSVEMRHINKNFGGVHALKDVTVQFYPGEIHSIVGENGAGKSTLIKILSGAYMRDSGEILINGKKVDPKSTFDMKKQGIGVIYQEFALAQDCTVAENIFIHRLSEKGGLVKWKKLNLKTKNLISEVGFDIDPTEVVGNLSVAYQQIVEITKAFSEDINVLILDEPTAVLSPYETQMLFEILKNLKAKGATIIYISHRLEDVIALSDRITVFRDGEKKSNFRRGEIDGDGLVGEMIGRNPDTYYPRRENIEIKEEVLRVENLRRGNVVKDISFSVHSGEVLGIAGLLGSGKTESVRLVFGADKRDGGEIYVENKKVKIRNPHDAMRYGINYLSESRKDDGVLLDLEIRENITLSDLRSVSRRLGVLDRKKEVKAVTKKVNDFMIKCGSIHHPVSSLSGGNQQKVSIAKTLYINNKVVILDEPTRGVDVGAKVEIYNIINEMVAGGLAVIFVSSEIEEIVGMCDIVIVIGQGRVMGELKAEEIEKSNIIGLSAGVKS